MLPYRLNYMQFLTPTQPFGYVVVGPGPVFAPQPSAAAAFFSWRNTFTDAVWVILFGAMLVVGVVRGAPAPPTATLPPPPVNYMDAASVCLPPPNGLWQLYAQLYAHHCTVLVVPDTPHSVTVRAYDPSLEADRPVC